MSSAESALNRTPVLSARTGYCPALPVRAAGCRRRCAEARSGSVAPAAATAARPAAITTGAAPTADATRQLRYATRHASPACGHHQRPALLAVERYTPGRCHAVQQG